jgi:hypothetical protein
MQGGGPWGVEVFRSKLPGCHHPPAGQGWLQGGCQQSLEGSDLRQRTPPACSCSIAGQALLPGSSPQSVEMEVVSTIKLSWGAAARQAAEVGG